MLVFLDRENVVSTALQQDAVEHPSVKSLLLDDAFPLVGLRVWTNTPDYERLSASLGVKAVPSILFLSSSGQEIQVRALR
mgnify:CR=1 FL=1